MVCAWFYCIGVCYNIMYYFLHFVHVLFVISLIILTLLMFYKYNYEYLHQMHCLLLKDNIII